MKPGNYRTYATFGVLNTGELTNLPLTVDDPIIPVYIYSRIVGHAKLGTSWSDNVCFLFLDYSSPLRLDLENGERRYLLPELAYDAKDRLVLKQINVFLSAPEGSVPIGKLP